jgi:acylphosphatase
MPCLHLLISGKVQGVWFRESMRQEALALGATGWVRNLSDGKVEAVVCGSEETVKALLTWAKRGPPLARVNSIETRDIPDEAFSSFEKR